MTSASPDVIVLGAGAAGLMCALTAGRRGRRVLVLDHARRPGEKILISGGGRCNFTNLDCAPERFLSANPHFARSALSRYTPQHFLELVDRHGIAWHEKAAGQLFCDGSARQIVDMLLAECAAAGVEIRTGHRVTDVAGSGPFRVETDGGAFTAARLVLATGGLSIPKIGATGFAHELAARFGLALVEPRPGLVPFVLEGEDRARVAGLAGLSAPVRATAGPAWFEDGMVVTHRGLSGPAILQASSYWRGGDVILDLLPAAPPASLPALKRDRPRQSLRATLASLLPQRLADAFLPEGGARPIGDVSDRALLALEATLRAWRLRPGGTEGYAKAEVTVGGVDTAGLSQKTLEARTAPGLHVIGEAVDVTGWLGGYNFQWAWASGAAAGEAV